MLDRESFALVSDMYDHCEAGKITIEPEFYFKRLALNLALELCYGSRVEKVDDPFFRDIVDAVETISSYVLSSSSLSYL